MSVRMADFQALLDAARPDGREGVAGRLPDCTLPALARRASCRARDIQGTVDNTGNELLDAATLLTVVLCTFTCRVVRMTSTLPISRGGEVKF